MSVSRRTQDFEPVEVGQSRPRSGRRDSRRNGARGPRPRGRGASSSNARGSTSRSRSSERICQRTVVASNVLIRGVVRRVGQLTRANADSLNTIVFDYRGT